MEPADNPRPTALQRIDLVARTLAGCFLAAVFIGYGVAKMLGTQFIRSGSALDKPVSELSGFELTWIYFGYSPLMSNFVAFAQVACGVLMVFRRTRVIGALGLLPIIANIVLINFGYNISRDTKVVSVVYLILALYLASPAFLPLARKVWELGDPGPATPRWLVGRPALSALIGMAFVGAVTAFEWTLLTGLKQQYMGETVLTGDWSVKDSGGLGWQKVCFEQAGSMAVKVDGEMRYGRYKVDEQARTLQIRLFKEGPPREPDEATLARFQNMTAEEMVAETDRIARATPSDVWIGKYKLWPGKSLELVLKRDGQTSQVACSAWAWRKF